LAPPAVKKSRFMEEGLDDDDEVDEDDDGDEDDGLGSGGDCSDRFGEDEGNNDDSDVLAVLGNARHSWFVSSRNPLV
jgi:hypothetical protein